jgi:tRNA-2-methylthio-N6-dimethylallyladenosine synthase
MEDIRFDAAFIFKYSQRNGTYAARKLPDDVAPEEKTRRIVELVELQKRITGEINQSLVGSVQEVLLEEAHEKDAGKLVGRTDSHKTTVIPADGVSFGDIVDVQIDDARGATLFGRAQGGARRTAVGG